MEKISDKMKIKLQELLEIQQRRIDKMRLNQVRVSIVGSGQFYATLKITNEEIIIKPDDPDRLALIFYDCHLNGFHESGRNGLKLNQKGGRTPIQLFFRTRKQLDRALKRVRQLTGSETTPESSSASESS